MTANKKLVFAVTLLCTLQVNAQWTTDPAVNTPVCTTTGTQQIFPQVVGDENGGVYFAWMETNADMTSVRIFAQHLSPAGTKLWAAGGIEVSGGSGILTTPQIVSDGNGGAIISWINQVGTTLTYYMQRVSSTGQLQWTPGGVLVSDVVQPVLPNYLLLADTEGGASVLWDDIRGGNSRVYAQHIDAAGNRSWADEGLPISPEFTDYLTFDAVPDSSGGIIFCFGKQSGLLNLHEIYVQHINADGIAEWGSDGINLSNVPRDQLFPRIAKDSNDHVIVVWQDHRLDPAWSQIYGQRIDSVGNLQWGPNGKMLVDSVVPNSTWLRIVTDSKKGAVMTWFDEFVSGDDTAQIFACRIDSIGSIVYEKKEVASWVSQVPTDYKVVPDYKGGAYINFLTVGVDGNDQGAQHVLPNGSLEFPLGGMVVTTAPLSQQWQQLMCDSNGLAVIAWADQRSMTEFDLYAMRIGAPTTLPVTWIDFAGKLTGSSIILTWKTADEENNKGFTIQRSGNGNLFDSIGYKAAGTQYSFTDLNPLPAQNYYRLMQTDIDGKTSYSRVIRIDREMTNRLRLYPNPARGKIVVSGIMPGSRLSVYDSGGRQRKQIIGSSSLQEIYVHDLPKGLYYLVDEGRKNHLVPFFIF
jgi:hypothetical protein